MSIRPATIVAALALLVASCASNGPSTGESHASGVTPSTNIHSGCVVDGGSSGSVVVGKPMPASTQITITAPPPDLPGTLPERVLPSINAVSVENASDADRVVVQLDGDGQISWSLRIVAEAYDRSSGELVAVGGHCPLQFDIADVKSGAGSVTEVQRLSDPAIKRISEVVRTPLRSSTDETFIGVEKPAARVSVEYLAEPSRLVVSVR